MVAPSPNTGDGIGVTQLPTICFLTGTLNAFAGAERMTAVIANALAARGYRVLILSLWDQVCVFPLHPAVEHCALFAHRPSFKRQYASTVLGIRRFVREHGVEVLVEVDTMLTLFTLPATLGRKVRRISWEHCHFDEDLGRPVRKMARFLAARTCTDVVVLTKRDRMRWMEALRPPCNIVHIPNPLPFPLPHARTSRDTRTVLAVGRLTRAKGFDVLLKAWQQVAQHAPDWKLLIVGEGEERGQLEALCHQLGLEQCVSLPGVHTEIARTYAQSTIFCLSSRYEGFGLVLIEAMAFGLPIVSTNCDQGPRELLADHEDALMVPVEDETALADAVLTLIEDPAIAERLAIQGKAKASHFAIESIADQWTAILGATP
ncbi:glycosyltransferase family 4 protein [Ralstonia insidiosa]|jgi:glycosyltransferase involved in cell wall biosynthesis|uniref:glycosyltransferase family 4 protein n=2 Tax=Pseudomonadota TaxID=1224 RepID=UPI000664ADF7|nr:glycosyltransferase family 4 protein [Ralstonia insidiosa]KMW45222.1 glycosyl transferase [Ralstonia sp. MD27]MBX3774534.1 glycosyltransferase family 4 protein [Ralstonia pickettii]NOZ18421.1 glycosyltransferase family 4 protein [Betaproteobacteria bacterium]MBA9858976.1 glycosyltransferase family 4 protein [Ralstonia insidiosa]MBA9872679.1 glycosyltransferase family 4 protein [Ralstonia insidiosa]